MFAVFFYCDSPTPAVHETTTNSTAIFFGEALIFSCNEGYTHGNTGKTEFPVKCGADGKFMDTAVCEAVQCGSPSFPNVTVLGAGNMHFGQSDIGYCDRGYVTSQGLHYFVFTFASSGSFFGVQSCEVVTCAVPEMSNVTGPSTQSLVYGESLTVSCAECYHADGQSSFTISCQGATVTISGSTATSSVTDLHFFRCAQGSHAVRLYHQLCCFEYKIVVLSWVYFFIVNDPFKLQGKARKARRPSPRLLPENARVARRPSPRGRSVPGRG